MKWAFIFCFIVGTFCSCDRYPSRLSSEEQVQALIYEHLATQMFSRSSAGDDAHLLFLCYGDPQGDPSAAVQSYVSRAFRSVRPRSGSAPRTFGLVKERGTAREGIELRLMPFTISDDALLVIRASYFVGPKHGEGFEYRLQRVKGRWKIIDRKRLWIS